MNKTKKKVTKAIELKGGTIPIVTLQVLSSDLELITAGVQEKISQAQGFFQDAPIVLDLLQAEAEQVDLTALLDNLRAEGLMPVAARAEGAAMQSSIIAAKLGLLKARRENQRQSENKPAVAETEGKDKAQVAPLLQTTALRSGQQLYAKDSDLILTAHTSAGSEVVADGNIHIYGTLRGRALCGANGNTQARIFCQKLEADLVAIAGHYKLIDDIPGDLKGQAVQIWLENETLQIKKLTA